MCIVIFLIVFVLSGLFMELSTFPCIYWLFGLPSLVKYVLNLFAHFFYLAGLSFLIELFIYSR